MARRDNGTPYASDPPQSMICPITKTLMNDPVMDSEGYSYEKAAIEQWLLHKHVSPMTRAVLTLNELKPNRALKEMIQEFKATGKAAHVFQGMRTMKLASDAPIQAQAAMIPASVNISLDYSTTWAPDGSDDALVHLRFSTPKELASNRPPVDICLVIDTSGSMNAEAKIKTVDGTEEGDGLSLLDVVRHGVKTVMGVLKPTDRIAIVQYASRAQVVHRLRNMSEEGKATSTSLIDSLKPSGTTNLWDGLKMGLEVLRQDSETTRTQAIFLLTDGVPNIEPPRGHLPMLKKYFNLYPQMRSCVCNTFGFGYSLDSDLLGKLASEGRGMYSFIPDVGFVGTAFIHAISNTLSICCKNLEIELIPSDGFKITPQTIMGGHKIQSTGMFTSVQLGTACQGQSKDIILRIPRSVVFECKELLGATARYVDACTGVPVEMPLVEIKNIESRPDPKADTLYHFYRLELVSVIRNLFSQFSKMSNSQLEGLQLEHMAKPVAAIGKLHDELNRSEVVENENVEGLLQDLEGQVAEAISRLDWFKRWGRHYLPSLMFAHLTQQCNNFKDPGVQFYGGNLFELIRDEADDVFTALPPPLPTRIVPKDASHQLSMPARVPVQMNRYHCSDAPCFSGDSKVNTPSGDVLVKRIRKGDVVTTADGKTTKVKCVVVSKTVNSTAYFVEFPGGLQITPYHPVRVNNMWQNPQDLCNVYEHNCDVVYNFVLESEHVLIINGVECITLGHGFTDEQVAHPFLGTQNVIESLKECSGWREGLVKVNRMLRDAHTKLIVGLQESGLDDDGSIMTLG